MRGLLSPGACSAVSETPERLDPRPTSGGYPSAGPGTLSRVSDSTWRKPGGRWGPLTAECPRQGSRTPPATSLALRTGTVPFLPDPPAAGPSPRPAARPPSLRQSSPTSPCRPRLLLAPLPHPRSSWSVARLRAGGRPPTPARLTSCCRIACLPQPAAPRRAGDSRTTTRPGGPPRERGGRLSMSTRLLVCAGEEQ